MFPIPITSIASLSALGSNSEEIWKSYQNGKASFSEKNIGNSSYLVSEISTKEKAGIASLRQSNSLYKNLDDSVLFGIYTARKVMKKTGWSNADFGINIGSSRGATGLFEKYHAEFLSTGNTSTLASPTTTLGNISTWVAQDLGASGPAISHSITCSTALHAFLNGIAWLQSGMSKKFLVGGSEAPLTGFTLAQMKALKLYAREKSDFPCESLKMGKKSNSMILGEASGMACLEKESDFALANITGAGWATEKISHNISISTEAECFQKSMKMALKSANPQKVDVVVMHAPGTVKGDLAELKAIEKIFSKIPALTTNKWQIGHTFGASGMMSVEMAVMMLQKQEFIENPFYKNKNLPKKINTVMVNAVGFGGNAVSLILTTPKKKD